MSIRISVCLCLCGYFLCCCSTDNKHNQLVGINKIDNIEEINIDFGEIPEINLSDFLDTCFFVPLETNENSIIGNLDKVYCDENKIFILDKTTECILIFSMNGKFLYKINKKGKGPDEYYVLEDFYLNKYHKRIEIADWNKKCIVMYDYRGNHLSNIYFKQQIYYTFVSDTNDNFFFHFNNSHPKDIDVAILNSENMRSDYNSIWQISPKSLRLPNGTRFELTKPIAFSNNFIYSTFHYNDYIYRFNSINSEAIIKFNFEKKNSYPYLLKRYINEKIDNNNFFKEFKRPYSYDNIYVEDSILYLEMELVPKRPRFFYNLNSKKYVFGNFIVDKEECNLYLDYVIGTYNNYFISSNDFFQLSEIVTGFDDLRRKHGELPDEKGFNMLSNLLSQLDKYSNPVLMFFKPNVK